MECPRKPITTLSDKNYSLKTINLNIRSHVSETRHTCATHDAVVAGCSNVRLYETNGVFFVQSPELVRELGGFITQDGPVLWINLEPINTTNADYGYIGIPLNFLTGHISLPPDRKEEDILSRLSALVNDNDFIINYLRFEYNAYLLEEVGASLKDIHVFKWLIGVVYSLLIYLNELVVGNGFDHTGKLERQDILRLEAEISAKLHLSTPKVKEMAQSINMSTSKFKTTFKAIYHVSPHQYFLNKKLQRGLELLYQKKYTFSEIAYRLGFSHPSGLTRLFKSKLGETPTELSEVRAS